LFCTALLLALGWSARAGGADQAPPQDGAAEQGYVIVGTLQVNDEKEMAFRTYLLKDYAIAYNAAGKLQTIYEFKTLSWIDAGGQRTRLVDAQAHAERKRKEFDEVLKRAPDRSIVRKLKAIFHPTFTPQEDEEGRLTFLNPAVKAVVAPVAPAPSAAVRERLYLLDRMGSLHAHMIDPASPPPFVSLAVLAECRKRGIAPGDTDVTLLMGEKALRVHSTTALEPLTAGQYSLLSGLVERMQKQATASAKE
jgi:hypothetical protein